MNVRDAEAAEIDLLARIWYDAWQDANAEILPAELTRIRTLDSFRDRLQAALQSARVVGAPGEPVGFCIVAGDELYQLFVSALARGTGAAAALVADAEARLSASSVDRLASLRDRQRAGRKVLRDVWMAPHRRHHQPSGHAKRNFSAASLALRKTSAPGSRLD